MHIHSAPHGFDTQAWNLALEHAGGVLIAAALDHKRYSYSSFFKSIPALEIKAGTRVATIFLRQLNYDEFCRTGLFLTSLVVDAQTQMPKAGFFKQVARLDVPVNNRRAWVEEQWINIGLEYNPHEAEVDFLWREGIIAHSATVIVPAFNLGEV